MAGRAFANQKTGRLQPEHKVIRYDKGISNYEPQQLQACDKRVAEIRVLKSNLHLSLKSDAAGLFFKSLTR